VHLECPESLSKREKLLIKERRKTTGIKDEIK